MKVVYSYESLPYVRGGVSQACATSAPAQAILVYPDTEAPTGRLYTFAWGSLPDQSRLKAAAERHLLKRWWADKAQACMAVYLPDGEAPDGVDALQRELTGELPKTSVFIEPAREEPVDPLAWNLHRLRWRLGVDPNDPKVHCWTIFLERNGAWLREVTKYRRQLRSGLRFLKRLWKEKTGRPFTVKDWIVNYEYLLKLSVRRVVAEPPAGGRIKEHFVYQQDNEPDLILTTYEIGQNGNTERVLCAGLGVSGVAA